MRCAEIDGRTERQTDGDCVMAALGAARSLGASTRELSCLLYSSQLYLSQRLSRQIENQRTCVPVPVVVVVAAAHCPE